MKTRTSVAPFSLLKARINKVWRRGNELFLEFQRLSEASDYQWTEPRIDLTTRRFSAFFRELKRGNDASGSSDRENRELGRLFLLLEEMYAFLILKKHFYLVRSGHMASCILFTTAYGRELLMFFLLDDAEARGYDKIAYKRGGAPIWTLRQTWERADKGYLLKAKTAVAALIRLRERYLYRALRLGGGLGELEPEESLALRGLGELRIEESLAAAKIRRQVAELTQPIVRVLLGSLNANGSEFDRAIVKLRREVAEEENHAVEDFGWIRANNSSELRRAYVRAKRFRERGGSGSLTEERNLRGDLTWYGVICQLVGKKDVGAAEMLRHAFAPGWGGDLKNFESLLNECLVPWTRLKQGRPALKKGH